MFYINILNHLQSSCIFNQAYSVSRVVSDAYDFMLDVIVLDIVFFFWLESLSRVPVLSLVYFPNVYTCSTLSMIRLSLFICTLFMIMDITLLTLPACALTYAFYYDHVFFWKTFFFFFLNMLNISA